MSAQNKITPCLWFNFNAEEAVQYYTNISKRSRILEVSGYGDAMPQFKGKVLKYCLSSKGSGSRRSTVGHSIDSLRPFP
jgi:predicted 3-demethylubiquinone-9 3-methyltransferase (glyoxalase superfamily)